MTTKAGAANDARNYEEEKIRRRKRIILDTFASRTSHVLRVHSAV